MRTHLSGWRITGASLLALCASSAWCQTPSTPYEQSMKQQPVVAIGAGSREQLVPRQLPRRGLASRGAAAGRRLASRHQSAGTREAAAGKGASGAAGNPDAGAYEGLVTSDAPTAPPRGGPAKAPPDIGGVRLGMSPQEVRATLAKRYPGRKIDANKYQLYLPNAGPTPVAEVLESVSIGLNELVHPEDQIRILFTPPPRKPVVWAITRNLIRQNLNRPNTLASLRGKYGHESLADDGTYNAASNDTQVNSMSWIFDRQGRVVALPAGGPQSVDACRQRANGQSMFTYDSVLKAGHTEAQLASDLAISPWCSTSGIIVRADISPRGPIVQTLTVVAIDNPTVESAMHTEAEWLRKLTAARTQQAIDASKQSKPNL
jgi:hypothetical protein